MSNIWIFWGTFFCIIAMLFILAFFQLTQDNSNNLINPFSKDFSLGGEIYGNFNDSLTENDYYFERIYWKDSNKMEGNFKIFESKDSNKVILLDEKLLPEISNYYETFFPLEFGVCLNGDWKENKLVLTSLEKTDIYDATKTSISFATCLKGINLHSHPSTPSNNVYCEASDADFGLKAEFAGLACGRTSIQEILFYGKERKLRTLFISEYIDIEIDSNTKSDTNAS